MTKEIEQLIKERNSLQLKAENMGEAKGLECWRRLGVATRHINRLMDEELSLSPALLQEIEDCYLRVRLWLNV